MTPALSELVGFNARDILNLFAALKTLEGLQKLAPNQFSAQTVVQSMQLRHRGPPNVKPPIINSNPMALAY